MFSNEREMLMEVMYRLSKERSHEINKLKDKKKNAFIKRFLKSKYRYWFIVKLKANKYKKNFFCYLSFYFHHQTSLQTFSSLFLKM